MSVSFSCPSPRGEQAASLETVHPCSDHPGLKRPESIKSLLFHTPAGLSVLLRIPLDLSALAQLGTIPLDCGMESRLEGEQTVPPRAIGCWNLSSGTQRSLVWCHRSSGAIMWVAGPYALIIGTPLDCCHAHVQRAQTGGFRSAHGCASSNCDAIRSRVASSPYRPVNIVPMGSPSADQCSGREIAG